MAGEHLQLEQQRDSVWRMLQVARARLASLTLLARGANAQQDRQLGESRAKAITDEIALSEELTLLERRLSDLNATEAQGTATTPGVQERNTTDIRVQTGQQLAGAASVRTSRPAEARTDASQFSEPIRNAVRSTLSNISTQAQTSYEQARWQAIKNADTEHRTEKQKARIKARALAGTLKPPRKLFYFPLIYFAIGCDLLGMVLSPLQATGIGAVAIALVSFLIGSFFLAVSLFIGRKIKKSQNLSTEFSDYALVLERRAQLLRQSAAYAVRLARKVGGRSFVRTGYKRKAFVATVKFVNKYSKWLTKSARWLQLAFETTPILNVLPWYTINLILIYRERKHEYEAAMAAAAEIQPVDVDEEQAFGEFQQARLDVVAQTIRQIAEEQQVQPEVLNFPRQQPAPVPALSMRDVAVAA